MNEIISELKIYNKTIFDKFIKLHIGKFYGPDIYKIDVFSYCVLSHAAIENFIENISLHLMKHSISIFEKHKFVNIPLLTLIGSSEHKLLSDSDIKEINEGKIKNILNCIKVLIRNIKSEFSYAIQHNHGISIKYIYKLLYPLCINMQNFEIYLNSLKQLSNTRGEYAHKTQRHIEKILSPEDAQKFVDDCIQICENIFEQVNCIIEDTDIRFYGNDVY